MNSRERLITALNHQVPDRVPVDLAATRSGGISTIAYNNLKKYLGLQEETFMHDIQQQLCWPDEAILKRFGVDVIDSGRKLMEKRQDWKRFILNDDSEALLPNYYKYKDENIKELKLYTEKGTLVGVKPPSSLYVGQVHYPWEGLDEIPHKIQLDDFDEQLWSIISPPGQYDLADPKEAAVFGTEVDDLYNNTDYGLFMDLGFAGFFEIGMYMRGMENWFCDLMLDEAGVDRMLDIYLEKILQRINCSVAAVGNKIQVLRLGHDDMGNQNGLAVSPDLLRKHVFPRYRKVVDAVRKVSNAKIMLHSCGSIAEIIPDMINSGIDIINPLQMNCAGMNIKKIKQEYGNEIALWGAGCDAVDILTNKTVDEIKSHVREMLDICMPGGGFVFCNTHNIQADIQPEKITAIYETVEKYGKYR